MPASRASGVGYSIYQLQPASASANGNLGVAEAINTHFLATGKDNPTSNYQTWGAAFTVQETYGFDQKFDDGLANNGKVRTHYNNAGHGVTCTSGALTTYTYNLSGTGLCDLVHLFLP